MTSGAPAFDLNCDVAEVSAEHDALILPWVTSCNVCCGAHAGGRELIASTVAEALRLGVKVGAHPSYPDRANFGRKSVSMSVDDLASELRRQIDIVRRSVEDAGGKMRHVKAHGALYHDLLHNDEIADAFIDEVARLNNVAVVGMADSAFGRRCENAGLEFIHEVFGDRRYDDQATLRPRSFADSELEDAEEFQQHVVRLLSGKVIDSQQRSHSITTQTICLHGDGSHALEFAQLASRIIRAASGKSLFIAGAEFTAENFHGEFVLLKPAAAGAALPVIGRAILDRRIPFVDEVIAAETEICLKVNERFGADSLLELQDVSLADFGSSRHYRLPICFSEDGDWSAVLEHCEVTREDYLRQLLKCELTVAMFGFLPGFVYFSGLPVELQVPRKATPSSRTEPNSLAIGGPYAGVYSLPSPAGWNVLGQLPISLLQTDELPPVVLSPADRISLQQVSRSEFDDLQDRGVTLSDFNG